MTQQEPFNLPDRPFVLAIVGGLLGRARYHDALSRLSALRIAAIVDADVRSVRAWARELPGQPAIYATLGELLAAEDDLDAILIETAADKRVAEVETCLRAGVSVLSDYPNARILTDYDTQIQLNKTDAAPIICPLMPHRYESAFITAMQALESGEIGSVERVRSEVSFPMTSAYAVDNGLIPTGTDWYDILQVVAWRVIDLGSIWLGTARSVNADFDLPQHAAIAGRKGADPVANMIVGHDLGQATHLMKLSRSVHPFERYLITGVEGELELVYNHGEAATTVNGPTLRKHKVGQRSQTLYQAPDGADPGPARCRRALQAFVRAARSSPRDMELAFAGRRAMEAAQAAFLSAKEGIRIPLPLNQTPDIEAMLEL